MYAVLTAVLPLQADATVHTVGGLPVQLNFLHKARWGMPVQILQNIAAVGRIIALAVYAPTTFH